jgi:glycerophosphoryl diester phosphodiesterase
MVGGTLNAENTIIATNVASSSPDLSGSVSLGSQNLIGGNPLLGPLGDNGLLTLDDLVRLVLDWNRPVKLFIETKHPVRYGALVESKVLALLHRYGIAAPASADLSRAVVMSFSAAAVWRIRRAAPLLPTVLLGETSRFLGGSAATTVGATAVGPSIATLREHPELVDRAPRYLHERYLREQSRL